MKDKKIVYGLIGIALIILIGSALAWCITNNGSMQVDNSLSPNKYVAIQEERNDVGTIVSGYNPAFPEAPVPQLFLYNTSMVIAFYNKSGIYPPNYPEMNQSLKILQGTYYIDTSPARYNNNLVVRGIYNFPYNSESGASILGVDKNGTVEMMYGNESIHLNSGDSWTSPITQTRNETVNGIYNGKNYTAIIKYSTTWQIINKGIFDK
jgi:hypothetical protein